MQYLHVSWFKTNHDIVYYGGAHISTFLFISFLCLLAVFDP